MFTKSNLTGSMPVAIIKGTGPLSGKVISMVKPSVTEYNYDSSDQEESDNESKGDDDYVDDEKEEKPKKKKVVKKKGKKAKGGKKNKSSKNDEEIKQPLIFNNMQLKGDNHFILLPSMTTRSNICLIGTSGSGKSFMAAQYAKAIKKLFPDFPVYVVSEVSKDEVLDELGVIRVPINKDMYEEPVDVEKLQNCLIIFDDIDQIKNKKIRDATLNFRKEVLNKGRHSNIYTICTNHELKDRENVKDMLRESHATFLFPRTNSKPKIRKYLADDCGLSKTQVTYIMSRPSRWICIYKNPMFCLTENEIFSLDADD